MAALGMNSKNITEKNIKLTVAYDGSAYHGFQRQTNALTIQQVLEEKLSLIMGGPIVVAGSARTDAGVHAYGQVISFRAAAAIPTDRIPAAARSVLPRDIVVTEAEEMPSDFHARFSATGKQYAYRILTAPKTDPIQRNYAWQISQTLDLVAMKEVLQSLIGEHHFGAFQSAGSSAKSPVRTLYEASCARLGEILEFNFHGNGFLYHMIRNIVGSVVEVGTGKISTHDFNTIFQGQDRRKAGITAPASGLFLMKVFYKKS